MNQEIESICIEIEFKQGRWLVNDKRIAELNEEELNSLNKFFAYMKTIPVKNN